MNPDEIVVHVVDGKRGDVIFDPLRKRVGQPGVSAHLHSQGEILSLDKAGADVLRVRFPDLDLALTANTCCWTVPGLWSAFVHDSTAVNLPHDSVVHFASEGRRDRVEIKPKSIGRELNLIRQPHLEIVNERVGRLPVTIADHPGANQLGVGIHGDPRPDITRVGILSGQPGRDVSLLGSDERPNFVALNSFALKVYKVLAHVFRTDRAKIQQELVYRVAGHVRHACRRPNRVALDQCRNHLSLLPAVQLVHTLIIQRSSIESSTKRNKHSYSTCLSLYLPRKGQFGLGLLGPAGLCRFSGDLRAFLGAKGSRAGRATLEATETPQRHSGGILGPSGWWFRLGRFADGLKKNLMRELVRIAGPFAGAVRHNAFSMAGRGAESRA
jgi:hypothetical protein